MKQTQQKKWDELTPSEKEVWDAFAKKNNSKLKVYYFLCSLKRCPLCKKDFPDGIIIKKQYDNRTPLLNKISGDFLFHIQSTHGIFPDTLLDILNEIIKKGDKDGTNTVGFHK
jgi:hypothetical protein